MENKFKFDIIKIMLIKIKGLIMSDYLNTYGFFEAGKDKKFDDGEGNPVSLGEHLAYLNSEGGTPDCFDIVKARSAVQAKVEAKKTGLDLYVVDLDTCRVVGRVNQPEVDSEMSM